MFFFHYSSMVTFFRSTQTLCSDCALTISDIAKQFFHPTEKGTEKKMSERLFSISSRGQLRSRTKSKIIGFSKTARWISMKIKLRGHFSILFQLRISKAQKSKFEKIDFLKILPICTCKVEKNPKIFTPDFEVFNNWR